MRLRTRGARRSFAGVITAGLITAVAVPAIPSPTSAQEATGPRVVAADGSVQPIDAIDPSSRTAGLFAVYTPEFGPSTKTNEYGGEAVLRETATSGEYEVVDVCTVFDGCGNAGDNVIPQDGLVLSASPGGEPDVRLFLRDHMAVGDVVEVRDLTIRAVSTEIDATDPTAETNPPGVDPATGTCYPGCRGADQLVIYTPESGKTTGTNDFGFEVGVVDGRVVERGGNDRSIPADGFVLSGHGGRGSWLSSNAVLGARVTIDGSTLTLTIDASTYVYGAEQTLLTAQHAIDTAGEQCVDAPLADARTSAEDAERLLAESRAAIDAGDPDEAVELAEQARDAAELAGYRTAESRPVEGRPIWVRPTETTPKAIETTLDRIASAGINVVLLETVWQGYTIHPSDVAAEYGITAQRPEFAGFDPLRVWIDEAHERGIELHPWVHTFFVGSEAANGGPGPVLDVYPEWAAVEREDVGADRPMPSSQEPGYYFVDPAIPEAREYVRSLLDEIMTGYDVDGLHLDYIRYPVSQPWETAAYSYSDGARAQFERDHGVDPYELTPDDALWAQWNAWREAQVTTFVASVRDLQRSVAPDIHVSAAVFPDPSDGLDKKFQNWADWAEQGYVDILTGMSFGTSGESVARDTALMRAAVGESNLLYTATYGPFRGSPPDIVLEQVQAVRDAGSDGAALFAFNQLSGPQAEALAAGAFRTKAVVPHGDLVLAAITGARSTFDQLRKAHGDCVTTETWESVNQDLRRAEASLRRGDLDRALRAFDTVHATVTGDPTVQPQFADRVGRDVEMYGRWVERSAETG